MSEIKAIHSPNIRIHRKQKKKNRETFYDTVIRTSTVASVINFYVTINNTVLCNDEHVTIS